MNRFHDDKFYSGVEVCRKLGIESYTLSRLISRGKLISHRGNGEKSHKILGRDINQFIRNDGFELPPAKVISLAGQKGGIGKTTTAVNLAAGLANLSFNVLLIDSDPQANASINLFGDEEVFASSKYFITNVFDDDRFDIRNAIKKTHIENLDMILSHLNLSSIDFELYKKIAHETLLKRKIEPILSDYEYIIIDCPPSLGSLTTNAICAATFGTIVPLQAEYFALVGLAEMINTIENLKSLIDKHISLLGILFTMHDIRPVLPTAIRESVSAEFKDRIFKTTIPRNISLMESQHEHKTIFEYAPRSKGATAYKKFVEEVIERV